MQIRFYLLLIALITLTASGCNDKKPDAEALKASQPPAEAAEYTGTVVETMGAAGYTYVLVDTGREKIWAAGPACTVRAGDRVTIPGGMPKENCVSKTLSRTFEKIYFVESIGAQDGGQKVCSVPQEKAMDGTSRAAGPPSAGVNFSGIKKAEGGKTVAEIYAEKGSLAGRQVSLRGKVVKFNAEIMGKNWAHVQDGTGAAGSNDLTVTTKDTAKAGDTVLVRGAVVLDKDFGYGYTYAVLIDNGTLRAE